MEDIPGLDTAEEDSPVADIPAADKRPSDSPAVDIPAAGKRLSEDVPLADNLFTYPKATITKRKPKYP